MAGRRRPAEGLYPICGQRGTGETSGGFRSGAPGAGPGTAPGIPGSPGGRTHPGRSFWAHCGPGVFCGQRGQSHLPSRTDPPDGDDDGTDQPGFHLCGLPSGGSFRLSGRGHRSLGPPGLRGYRSGRGVPSPLCRPDQIPGGIVPGCGNHHQESLQQESPGAPGPGSGPQQSPAGAPAALSGETDPFLQPQRHALPDHPESGPAQWGLHLGRSQETAGTLHVRPLREGPQRCAGA